MKAFLDSGPSVFKSLFGFARVRDKERAALSRTAVLRSGSRSGVLGGVLASWLAFWRSGWRSGVLAGVLLWRSGGWRSAWRSGVLAFSISGVLAFWRSGWRSGVLVGVLAFCLAFCSASGGSPAMLLLAPFRGFSFQTPFWIYLLFPSGGSVFKSLFGFL